MLRPASERSRYLLAAKEIGYLPSQTPSLPHLIHTRIYNESSTRFSPKKEKFELSRISDSEFGRPSQRQRPHFDQSVHNSTFHLSPSCALRLSTGHCKTPLVIWYIGWIDADDFPLIFFALLLPLATLLLNPPPLLLPSPPTPQSFKRLNHPLAIYPSNLSWS